MNDGSIVKTYDLTMLNKICIQYDCEFRKIEEDCIELVDYGVQVRYPVEIDLEEYDMNKAIESAEEIKDFILNKSSV